MLAIGLMNKPGCLLVCGARPMKLKNDSSFEFDKRALHVQRTAIHIHTCTCKSNLRNEDSHASLIPPPFNQF